MRRNLFDYTLKIEVQQEALLYNIEKTCSLCLSMVPIAQTGLSPLTYWLTNLVSFQGERSCKNYFRMSHLSSVKEYLV